MATFKSIVATAMAAAGLPNFIPTPDGMAYGPFGWTLEQAQGTTANYDGTIIDLAATVTSGGGNTAGTASRCGGALDSLSSTADPNVILRLRDWCLDISNVLDFSAQASDIVSQLGIDFVEQCMRNIRTLHNVGSAKEQSFPAWGGVRTLPGFAAATATYTAEAGQAMTASEAKTGRAPLGNGLDVNLDNDTFTLDAQAAVPLPTGATIRTTAWYFGAGATFDQTVDQSARSPCPPENVDQVAKNMVKRQQVFPPMSSLY